MNPSHLPLHHRHALLAARSAARSAARVAAGLCAVGLMALTPLAHSESAEPAPAKPAASAPVVEGNPRDLEAQVREAMKSGTVGKKKLNLILDTRSAAGSGAPGAPPPVNPVDGDNGPRPPPAPMTPPMPAVSGSRAPEPGLLLRPRNPVVQAAPHKEVHWSYEGEGGPEHWAELRPEYATCAKGQRQSPIAIDDREALQGPAEPVDFHYRASLGSVTNNGHTLEVKVYGDNNITVRGTTFQLVQFHFHHPSEERINGQTYPMVAHLVHRSDSGQLAVVAVLFEVGDANPLIDKVWTYVPLDVNDTVRTPADLVHVAELLPGDQRYYQFFGSLTTPPCTEGVLWIILKQPVTLSREQMRLFTQLFPNNARPIQQRNQRPVRSAVTLTGNGSAGVTGTGTSKP